MTDRLVFTVAEAAALLGISRNSMYQLTRRADFPILHVGKRKLIPNASFVAWLEKQTDDKLFEGRQ